VFDDAEDSGSAFVLTTRISLCDGRSGRHPPPCVPSARLPAGRCGPVTLERRTWRYGNRRTSIHCRKWPDVIRRTFLPRVCPEVLVIARGSQRTACRLWCVRIPTPRILTKLHRDDFRDTRVSDAGRNIASLPIGSWNTLGTRIAEVNDRGRSNAADTSWCS